MFVKTSKLTDELADVAEDVNFSVTWLKRLIPPFSSNVILCVELDEIPIVFADGKYTPFVGIVDDFGSNESWRLHSITLLPNSKAVGKTLDEIDLGSVGVSVQAVRRKGRNADYVKLTLTPELRLEENDILVISGNSEATDLAEAKLL